MRENTTSITIMDAKIERCVEPLFKGGGLKKNDDKKDDGENVAFLSMMKRRTKRRKIFELTTKVYALCALNGDLDLANAIERVDVLLLALKTDDDDDDTADDSDFSRSWAKTKIEKQLRMKQRRLKERKDPFAEKEWVRFLAREEGKEILEELFRMVLSSSVSSSSSSSAAGEERRDVRDKGEIRRASASEFTEDGERFKRILRGVYYCWW